MEDTAELETLYRIWSGFDGAYLQIEKDGEGMITVKTKDHDSEVYFGVVNFRLEPRIAKRLAEALAKITQE